MTLRSGSALTALLLLASWGCRAGGVEDRGRCSVRTLRASYVVPEPGEKLTAASCLPAWLHLDETGRLRCTIVETLPTEGEVSRCDALPGREVYDAERVDPGTGGERCLVTQVIPDRDGGSPPDDPGWYVDDFSRDARDMCGDAGRIVQFTADAEPVPGARLELECTEVRPLEGPAGPGVGNPCDREPTCPPTTDVPGARFCHYSTCQRYCERDADCPVEQVCLDMAPADPPICGHPQCAAAP